MKLLSVVVLHLLFSNSVYAESDTSDKNILLNIKSSSLPFVLKRDISISQIELDKNGKKILKNPLKKNSFLLKKKIIKGINKRGDLYNGIKRRAGAGSSGGGQGIVDQYGKLQFIDILNEKEIENLNVQRATDVDIISDIKCTNQLYENSTDSQFKNEIDEAVNLLVTAGKVLIPENPVYFPEGNVFHMIPLTHYFLPQTMRITSFKLPQIYDATQVDSDSQVQIAIYNWGTTYYQKQALLRLKEKARAVFIKEALRNTNFHEGLGLSNKALEKATYYIYHGEIENFSNSEFAKKFRSEKVMIYTGMTDDEFSFFGVSGTMIGLKLARVSEIFDYVAVTSQVGNNYAPKDMLWSTQTGELIHQKDCHKGE